MDVSEIISISAIVSLVLITLLRELRGNKTNKVENSLYQSNQLAQKIYPILWKLLISVRASRLLIIEFHNGTRTYSGQSIQKMSTMYEVGMEEIHKISSMFDNTLVTETFHRIVTSLRAYGEYYIPDKNEEEFQKMKSRMILFEAESLYVLPIRDDEGQITGMMMLTFFTKDWLSKIDKEKIKVKRDIIQNLLLNKGTKSKKNGK